jgi:glycerol uptake facilitator-like aquaporin
MYFIAEMNNFSGAGIFASYPTNEFSATATLVFDQALGTACLLLIILAVTDKR